MSEHDKDPASGEASQPSGEAPQLGVPALGVPELGTPPPQSTYNDPDPNDPRNYPGSLPAHLRPQQPPPKQRRRGGVSRVILLVILVLVALGWVVTQVRHARATPADKAACSATLSALTNPAVDFTPMLNDLELANDKTLLAARGDMTTHIMQKNLNALGDDLNKVIHRCNQVSSEFKTGFQSFCDSHPGYCKQTFHIGPF